MVIRSCRGEREVEFEKCRDDIMHWVMTWVDTYDPRFIADGCPPVMPFQLFPKQADMLLWMQDRERCQEDGVCEKSREVGVTWLCCAYLLHGWLFRPGFRGGVGSRKLELVDKIGDPKSIFEKIRMILRGLPVWMIPKGFSWSKHDNHCRLLNPSNGSTISGEGGDEIGRGDRASLYIVDEAASIEHPEMVDAALSQTTRCRIDVSTPKGTHIPFYKKLISLPERQRFRIHWKDDPRKSQEWYDRECKRIGDPYIIAQELDIDHAAAAEGLEWPAAFFDGILFDDWPPDIDTRVMALDPSKGKADRSGDYSAWIMLGVDRDGCLWVDADIDNARPVEQLASNPGQRSIVSDGYELYRGFGPTAVLVETNGFQEMVATALYRYAVEKGVYLPIYTVNHNVPKAQRIRTLTPFLSQKRLRVRNTRGGQMLIQQMRDFPVGEHDDGPDALAASVEMANRLIFGEQDGNKVHVLVT